MNLVGFSVPMIVVYKKAATKTPRHKTPQNEKQIRI
jgi:hypothetical protein